MWKKQQHKKQEGADVSVGSDTIISTVVSGLQHGVSISSNMVGNMVTTSKGVVCDGQPFGCAPLHPAM